MNRPTRHRWTEADRFAFTTQRLRASTVPGRRHAGPTADEWDDDEEDDHGDRIQRHRH